MKRLVELVNVCTQQSVAPEHWVQSAAVFLKIPRRCLGSIDLLIACCHASKLSVGIQLTAVVILFSAWTQQASEVS